MLLFFSYLQYFDHRRVFDPFLTQPGAAADPFQSHSNPWISDTVDYWQHDKMYEKFCKKMEWDEKEIIALHCHCFHSETFLTDF